MIAVLRVRLFFEVNLGLIDSDQPFMWIGAKDYSNGYFFEPRFYGQDYNTFLEALIAVPFIRLNMPVYVAVPLVTHLILLLPFLFTGFYLFVHQKKEQA